MARSAAEAIRIERKWAVDDVWLDDDWKKAHPEEPKPTIGFRKKQKKK